MIKIKKGLDVPISGAPVQTIRDSFSTKLAAVVGADFNGMKPTMAVKVGDHVKIGQVLFSDKKKPSVVFTSPCSGTIKEVNRGAKRVFQSIVIERSQSEEFVEFDSYKSKPAASYSKEEAIALLLESGHWNNLRTRPFSLCPNPESVVKAIFVTAADTHPLAAQPGKVIESLSDEFCEGLTLITHLTEGKVHVCSGPQAKLPGKDIAKTQFTQFSGPHPSGNVGTHIHHLNPVSANKAVWHLNYQDVIAIGHLLKTGHLKTQKVIALAGPKIKEPRLVTVNKGACISEIVEPNKKESSVRAISGSVLSGRTATGPFDYLGQFHSTISVIQEGMEREFFGWQKPGFDKYTVTRAYFGKYFKKFFDFTSSAQGSLRAMVPIGSYEKVLPLDILPTQLLRALLSYDTDQAQALGCLELDEEDLSLCTFVCSSKINFGPKLRENLNIIEKEG